MPQEFSVFRWNLVFSFCWHYLPMVWLISDYYMKIQISLKIIEKYCKIRFFFRRFRILAVLLFRKSHFFWRYFNLLCDSGVWLLGFSIGTNSGISGSDLLLPPWLLINIFSFENDGFLIGWKSSESLLEITDDFSRS